MSSAAADLALIWDEHIGFCIEALKPIAKELGRTEGGKQTI